MPVGVQLQVDACRGHAPQLGRGHQVQHAILAHAGDVHAQSFSQFFVGEPAGAQNQDLGLDGLEAGEDSANATALFLAQNFLEGARAGASFDLQTRGGTLVLSAPDAGAQGVNAHVRRRAVQPAGHIPVTVEQQALAVEPPEDVVRQFLGSRPIAHQTAQYADDSNVVGQVQLFERGVRPLRALGFSFLAHLTGYVLRCCDHRAPPLAEPSRCC